MTRSILRFVIQVIIIWMFLQLLYQTGDKKTTEEDFNSVVKELPTFKIDESTQQRLDSTYKKMRTKKDTTKYPGKWVDTN